MKVECDNCAWGGDENKCDQAEDIHERHAVGVLYSNLACPKCGSLCYPTDPTTMYPYTLFVACVDEAELKAVEAYRDTRRASAKGLKGKVTR